METESKTYAQTAFEAYVEAVGGKTYDGKDIPKWNDLTDSVRDAWAKASGAVIEAYDPEGLVASEYDDEEDDPDDY